MSKFIFTGLFALAIAMVVFLAMPSRAMANGDCGGLNQKSCWSLNPKDWCKPGLEMVTKTHLPGSGHCVRPVRKVKDCGGLGQKSCLSLNPKDWCDPGLEMVTKTHLPGSGHCVRPVRKVKDCGGLNQKSCWSFNPKNWCDAGLKAKGFPGHAYCRRPPRKGIDCGGPNEKSCWSFNPKDWCAAGLEVEGIPGKCVVPDTKNCGALGQKSCWSLNPKNWCEPGLKEVGTWVPGSGRCVKGGSIKGITDAAAPVFARIKALGTNNPLINLYRCLSSPSTLRQLQAAMKNRSADAVNSLLHTCQPDRQGLLAMITRLYSDAPTQPSVSGSGMASADTPPSASPPPTGMLHIELSGTVVAVGGIKGAAGYAVQLSTNPRGHFYVAVGAGGGAASEKFSGDLSIGLSAESVPTQPWARDQGKSLESGAYIDGGATWSIDFPGGTTLIPNGFSIAFGGGEGEEFDAVFYSLNQYIF